ncbi:hypothetical protein GX51_06273 [Blastomyces parvus]|uniref:Uncharacterized protein n=1 Tax=Blastomyces parvus TaxID=2060905 RepID=A0A2B7WJI7_9EURO|nr:hypothetical protein GX51_06273 [Blastomyces parvus]
MKILRALFLFLTAAAVGQSISPPTRADLAPSTQEVTVDEAHPIPDISARGLGKFKNIFDKVKEKGDDKGKKPKEKTESKKGEDKKDGKDLTESKMLSKKKFKFKGKKGKGKGKGGGGGGGEAESMAATGPKAPLLFVGGLLAMAVPYYTVLHSCLLF